MMPNEIHNICYGGESGDRRRILASPGELRHIGAYTNVA